jgi:hypothetical protein
MEYENPRKLKNARSLSHADARDLERRKIIGRILAKVGIYRLAGQESIAAALDVLATELEIEPTLEQLQDEQE